MWSINHNQTRLKRFFKLLKISKLKKNWNGYNAEPIPRCIMLRAMLFNLFIPVHMDVFPTAVPSIQFDYDSRSGNYIEFEVRKNNILKMFIVTKDRKAICRSNVSNKTAMKYIRKYDN